jgi:hypothetical protein
VCTSDLQGIVPDPRTRASTLLGVAVAAELDELGFAGVIPRAMRSGVLLAGDLYTVPEATKRGGFGDVADVWAAFADRFAWVVGVAGNHDDVSRVHNTAGVSVLDGDVVELEGLKIGGVGYVVGDPNKKGRRDEDEQVARVELVAESGVDALVLHEGPELDDDQIGHVAITRVLEEHAVPFTLCGHRPWSNPLAVIDGRQVLNVHERVVVLCRP